MPFTSPPIAVPFTDPTTGMIAEVWRIFLRNMQSSIVALAPVDAPYWVSTSAADLTAERNLGALATGYLKITVAAAIATPSTVTAIPQADVTGLVADLALKAALASPALSGVPTAPTAALGTDTTQVATTAFVLANRGATPRCVAYHSTTQSVPDSTVTVVELDSEEVDVGGPLHDLVTNNSRVTVPAGAGGFYVAVGTVGFASAAAGSVLAPRLTKNGATDLVAIVPAPALTGNPTIAQLQWAGVLAATDYLELRAYQQTGGALNIGSATRSFTNALAVWKVA
jgi:hypothetical protein